MANPGTACSCALGLLLLVLAVVAPLASAGPCDLPMVTVTANSVAQILTKRLLFPPTQAVRINLLNDIKLTSSLVFNASFSCTFFTTPTAWERKLWSATDAFPAFQIRDANNVLVQNVGVAIAIANSSGPCPVDLPEDTNNVCPAIFIHNSWAVQVVQATVRGRVDICRSPQTTLDWLDLSTAWPERGIVQVHLVGDGPNLIKSEVVISNCVFTGSQIGLVLTRAAVGVTVRNNFFKNQNFTGLQCGWGVKNVGDCMLTSFVNNYFLSTPDFTPQADSSAMYFGTHWVNPGNYLSCNYAKGGKQCLYLDYASSGITVDGMVCIGMPTGLKLNSGHANEIGSFVSVGARSGGWISCQYYYINNCNKPSGQFWDDVRLASFNSQQFQQDYPYLNDFCEQESFQGVDCNPPDSVPAELTGNCSGIPTGNNAKLVIVDSVTRNTPTYLSCPGITPVRDLNNLTWVTTPKFLSAAYFNDVLGDDYGVPELLGEMAPLRMLYGPGFKSCPKSENGPQPRSMASYLDDFNVDPNPAAVALMS